MAVDKDRFTTEATEILSRIAAGCYDSLDAPETCQNPWAWIKFGADTSSSLDIQSCSLGINPDTSNHRLMAEAAFVAGRKTEIDELRQLIVEGIPALDHHQFNMELYLHARSIRGIPCFRISLCGARLGLEREIYSIAIKLADIAVLLDGTPKPGNRVFLIDGQDIPAVDRRAAVQTYLALSCPHVLMSPPEKLPTLNVSEKIDPTPLLLAVLGDAGSSA